MCISVISRSGKYAGEISIRKASELLYGRQANLIVGKPPYVQLTNFPKEFQRYEVITEDNKTIRLNDAAIMECLEKDIVYLVGENPYIFKFKVNISKEDVWYKKLGLCAVCKTSENLTRHHIVPRRYIQNIALYGDFPGNNIDICRTCHDILEERIKNYEKNNFMLLSDKPAELLRFWKNLFNKLMGADI